MRKDQAVGNGLSDRTLHYEGAEHGFTKTTTFKTTGKETPHALEGENGESCRMPAVQTTENAASGMRGMRFLRRPAGPRSREKREKSETYVNARQVTGITQPEYTP